MDAGRSTTRILVVPRPRGGVTEQAVDHRDRIFIRSVRRVAPRTTRGVLMRVLRDVRDPGWSLATAAQALVGQVDGDLAPLRSARIHLLVASLDHRTLADARALATIEVAIAEVEAQQRQRRHPSGV